MAFTYTTRRGKTYYLHTGPKRGGGVQHYLSTAPSGSLADSIPEGFEVYETVNGQVYLRRKKPRLILDTELSCIERELTKRRTSTHRYIAEVTGDRILIHESTTDLSFLRDFNPFLSSREIENFSEKHANYIPVMRFALQDQSRRLFQPERYCFRGSVEDWIPIGEAGTIKKLAPKYLKHLGQESFYDLF